MKRIVAFLCLWLIAGPALAADHLEPEEAILTIGLGPDWVEREAFYNVIVNTVFAEAFDYHVLIRDVRGPGDSDSVVGIRTKGRHYELFRLRSKVRLYDYINLKGDEQAAAQRGGSSGRSDFDDDIRKRIPKRYQDVATERCAVSIDSETARRLIRVWRTMLRQTRFLDVPRQDHYASVLHHFSAALSEQYVMAGKTMQGEATGNAAMLVDVSNAMDVVCGDKTQLGDLQNKVMALEKSLGLPNALPPPADDEQGEFPTIRHAVFADGKLWLLRADGGLFTVTEGKMGSDEIALPEAAIDLWLDGNTPVVATCNPDNCRTWTLRRYEQTGWRDIKSIATNGEQWAGAAHTPEGTIILTGERLIEIGTDAPKITRLRGAIGRFGLFPVPPSLMVVEKEVVVGAYFGEWGGGVWRIDRLSGKVGAVTKHWKSQDGKREGDGELGPVNGLAWAPWQQDCFLAAVGLVHFMASGDMMEVCGTKVRQLYFKGTPDPEKPNAPCCSDAFFGLIPWRDGLLAVGLNGFYRITAAGLEPLTLKPHYVDYGDVLVSFDVPGAVLILSGVRASVALSGSTPFLVVK